MPAAVAVPALIGGAASLGSAIIGSKAAKSASKQQIAAGDKALAVNERVYADQQRQMAPYMALGSDAMNRYQSRYGSPGVSLGGNAMSPQMPQGGRPMPAGAQPTGQAMPRGGPSLGMALPGAQGGGMVAMRAPTGEVAQVPESDVPRLMAAGAVRVG